MPTLESVGGISGILRDFLAQSHDDDGRVGNSFDVRSFGARGDDTGDDGPAINAAINAAQVKGGEVFFPAGTYRVTTALTVPTLKAISYRGVGCGLTAGSNNAVVSELHFPTDFGAGALAIDARNSWHTTKIEGLKIRGVSEGGTLGVQAMSMDGIRFGSNMILRDVVVSGGFRAGLVQHQDHAKLQNVRSGGANFYGLLYPANANTHGDNVYLGCVFSGCMYASIAVESGTTCGGDLFVGTHLGFSPYGIAKLAGASSAEDFISNCHFLRSSIESIGNCAVYDASGFGKVSSSRWDKCGFTFDATNKIAADGVRRGIFDVYQLNDCYIDMGDIAGLPQYNVGTLAHFYCANGGSGNAIRAANWPTLSKPLFAGTITPEMNSFYEDAFGLETRIHPVQAAVASFDALEFVRISATSVGVRPAVSASGKPLAGVAFGAAASGYAQVIVGGGRSGFSAGPTAEGTVNAGDLVTPDGVATPGHVKVVAAATDRVLGIAMFDNASGKALLVRPQF